ncbi:MAG: hypothetical protein HQK88_13465 [Nitrospirae bacterium]|nr:hypothetical protein [Nitrospirota bacterium]MBF0535855.1 hypothetical protein [Nitrospirota bacterium]MBF0617811.1 hypothetical protein [Nitrospirota bacterium]
MSIVYKRSTKKDEPQIHSRRKSMREVKAHCINKECRLREKGCKGFEGCPGYKTI